MRRTSHRTEFLLQICIEYLPRDREHEEVQLTQEAKAEVDKDRTEPQQRREAEEFSLRKHANGFGIPIEVKLPQHARSLKSRQLHGVEDTNNRHPSNNVNLTLCYGQ